MVIEFNRVAVGVLIGASCLFAVMATMGCGGAEPTDGDLSPRFYNEELEDTPAGSKWVDAEGTEVKGIFEKGGELFWSDLETNVWRVDGETGRVSVAFRQGTEASEKMGIGLLTETGLAFESPDCSGDAYIDARGVPEPRYTFLMKGSNMIRVRSDTARVLS